MKSMTGFGSSRLSTPQCDLECQIRSVNGRFMELKINLPQVYLPFESELRNRIQAVLKRGSVSLYVARRANEKAQALEVRVNSAYAEKWIEGQKKLGKDLELQGEVDLNFLAKLPDVIQVIEAQNVTDAEKKSLFTLVDTAAKNCDEARIQEGDALRAECAKQVDELLGHVNQLEKWRSESDEIVRTMFREKLTRLGFDEKTNVDRINHEVALLIDKADIHEEIIRLREHLTNVKTLVKGRVSQGKKLDFYVQELLREINTIGSKTSVSKMTGTVVDSKVIIEKLREQVQNIE